MEITRTVLESLVKDIDAALVAVGKKHNLAVKVGQGGSFAAEYARLKIEVSSIKNGKAVSRKDKEFEMSCGSYQLKPADLGKRVWMDWSDGNSYEFKIVGISTRSRRCPIQVQCLAEGDDQLYRVPAYRVLKALGRKVPAWMMGVQGG